MNRKLKKILYGGFYIVLFGAIGFGWYKVFIESRPVSPEVSVSPEDEITPLVQVLDAEFYPIGTERVILFGRIRSASSEGDYYFTPTYAFDIVGSQGKFLQSVSGEAVVIPGQDTYVLQSYANVSPKDVYQVRLRVVSFGWKQGPLSFSVRETVPPIFTESEGEARVVGRARNESSNREDEVRVVGLLYDRFGFRFLALEATITNMRSFSEKEFSFLLPSDPEILRKAREGRVEVFFYPVGYPGAY